jgi:hypothetical protein
LKQCTIRIGTKRFLGTAAEALQRWAIDQGTLPRSEGGTQVAPVSRLAALAAEAVCHWPLALLQAEDLATLRWNRFQALGGTAFMLVEQAALAVAVDQFRDFHLPALDDPFIEAAPDGISLLDETACQLLHAQAAVMGGAWPRLVGLLLCCGVSLAELSTICCGQADRESGRLHLQGGRVVTAPSTWLPSSQEDATSLLLAELSDAAAHAAGFAALGQRLNHHRLKAETLQLTALVAAFMEGRHLDEVLQTAGGISVPAG